MARRKDRSRAQDDQPERRFDPLRFDPVKDAEELAQHIRKEAEERERDNEHIYRVMRFCEAFVFMRQWQSYDPITGRFWDLREITNSWGYTSPDAYESARYLISRLVSNIPRIGHVPKEQTERAERAAAGANTWLEYLDNVNETERKDIGYSFNLATLGTALAEVFINEGAKVMRVLDEKGNGSNQKVDIADHRILDPFRCFPAPGASDMGDCANFIRRDVMHVDEVYELYGVRLEPENVKISPRPNAFSTYGGVDGPYQRLIDHVNVFTTYIKGCKAAPNGKIFVTSREKVLKHGESPLENGAIPIIMWRYMVQPGQFWGLPYVLFQIPAIKAQNILYTAVMRSALRATSELWALPEGTEFDEDFDNRLYPRTCRMTGDQYPKNLANEINFIGHDLAGFLEMLKRHKDNAASFHDVSRAIGDPNQPTLGQTEIAEEKDIISMETAVRERQAAYRHLAMMRLYMQKKHGSNNIEFAVLGKNKPYDYHVWRKTDYEDELECYVYPDSGQPRTAAAKLRQFERGVELNLLPPEAMNDPEARYALSGIYGGQNVSDKVYRAYATQQHWARSENVQLAQGVRMSVSAGDIDKAHIPVHNAQYYDSEWRASASPFAVYILFDHIVMHETRREEKEYLEKLSQLDPAAQAELRGIPFEPVRVKPYEEELRLLRRAMQRHLFEKSGLTPEEGDMLIAAMEAEETEREAAQEPEEQMPPEEGPAQLPEEVMVGA